MTSTIRSSGSASLWLASAGLLVGVVIASGCVPESGEPLGWTEATGAPDVPVTATVALAEFEGYADPATGAFSVEVVRTFDPYTQLQTIYESDGLRTVGQALPRSTPAAWCTGRVVNDGALGTNPANTFELWTDPASIAAALPGAPTVPAACNVGNTSLYSIDGVFCATVRAMNFHAVPWSDVATQIYLFGGDAATQGGYAYPYGTGLQTVDGSTGDALPSYANLPDPGDELGIWGYGTLGAGGGQATRTWTFRNGSAGAFRFRGRVLGRVAEDCATPDVNEDCDPAGLGDNACRLYTTGEACEDDLDCVSYLCSGGACADGCRDGLWGASCQHECPGGWSNACSGHGACNDGNEVTADGSCVCDANYWGADCSVQCAPGQTWTQATGCVSPGCPDGQHDYFGDGLTCIDAQLSSVGAEHTCAIKNDHSLWCWGTDSSGQLGTAGVAVSVATPTRVGTWNDWIWVDAGWLRTCGLRYGGELYCWGNDGYGSLGDGGADVDQHSPVQIGGATDWTSVSTGIYHSCGVRGGALWCWGWDTNGQLGDGGSNLAQASPVQVGSETDWSAVSAGGYHTCGLRGGALWCWGYDVVGQLGDGGSNVDQASPVQVGSATDWSAVSAGGYHTCGLRDGALWCWGHDYRGQLGDGGTNTPQHTPVQVGSETGWSAVEAGRDSTCGVLDGALWCWGNDDAGQLGDGGEYADRTVPVQVGSETDWSRVAIDLSHGCGERGGALWCWGSNAYGQLGLGYAGSPSKLSPVRVGSATDWTSVSPGYYHTCGLRGGALWCWGDDQSGQVGDGGASVGQSSPVQVGIDTGWTLVRSGGLHACGLRGGTLWCWGGDGSGQLGDGGTNTNQGSPVQVGGATDWTSVSAGGNHTCGLRGGTLWCWGYDYFGQLGDGGSNADRSTPVQVGIETDWTSVSLGSHHSCGIRAGTLWCWGYDYDGQLGDGGTSMDRSVPVQIGGDTDWTSVNAGLSHTCGVRGGALWCWGNDSFGRLGHGGTTMSQQAPVQVGSATDWASVSAGGHHSCGLRGSTLWCWGYDYYGQLGIGGSTEQQAPVQVGSDVDWTSVGSGGYHTCGLRGSTLWCWGSDGYGELGIRVVTTVPQWAMEMD